MHSPTRIERIDIFPLDVPLKAPFTIATSRLDHVHNTAVRVTLADGSTGWGETPTLPPVTAEDQPTALAELRREAGVLAGRDAGEWRRIAAELHERIPDFPSVRAGLEMAVIDAFARHAQVPLFHFFGGSGNTLVTDITIPICSPDEAAALARQYRAEGFETLKIKIGLDRTEDVARIVAIRKSHPECRLILDANAGYTADETFVLLAALRRAGIEPSLLEQPVAREDWEGLSRLARETCVPVAADESCRSPEDALRIVRDGLARVINIKLVKSGVARALEIAAIARAGGLRLMIGGMVETRIAMGFSAHFAAGLGGFDWIDLDTPLLLADDPVSGGARAENAIYALDAGRAGHGGALNNVTVFGKGTGKTP
jgi:L-alanine-DL-glutamate epimerase-like enolase superfamily enzyme